MSAHGAGREAPERLAHVLLANIPDLLVRYDRELRRLYVNPAWEALSGLTAAEALGYPAADIARVPQPIVPAYVAALEEAFESGEPRQVTFEWANAKNVVLTLDYTIVPEFDESGRVSTVLAVGHDLTDRVNAERDRERALDRVRVLYESIPDALLVHGTDEETARILEVNDAACRMYGFSREELCAMRISDLDVGRRGEDLGHIYAEAAAGSSVTFERLHRTRDRGSLPVEITSRHSRLDDAAVAISIVRDISERRRATESLRRLNREQRAVSACNHAVIRATDEGALLDEICRVFRVEAGYRMVWVAMRQAGMPLDVRVASAAGVDVRTIQALADPPHRDSLAKGPVMETLRTGIASIVRDMDLPIYPEHFREYAHANGYRSMISLPLVDRAGSTLGCLNLYAQDPDAFPEDEVRLLGSLADDLAFGIGVLRERAGQRALEAQLRQAQKMELIGQLAGGIAHDFNNLLTAIRGYGELLRSSLRPDEQREQHDDASEILLAVDEASLLTRQLLAFARRGTMQPVVLEPGATLERLLPLLRRLIGEHIVLDWRRPSVPLSVKIDPGQLEQVVVNLVVNARDAMPDGGLLTVSLDRLDPVVPSPAGAGADRDWVVLTVTDTGEGMDEAVRAHLFEPFFTTKSEGKGNGLGLATVDGIVRAAGGFVDAQSSPGEGSTFTVLLPASPVDAVAEPQPRSPVARARLARGDEVVLVVDDNAAVRDIVRRTLEMLGYTVLEAGSGAEALRVAALHPGPIDLLLTDVVMPQMSGVELARRFEAARHGTRALFMSGFDAGAVATAEFPEATRLLAKPFSTEDLAGLVRRAIDGSG